jgi:hypothetical protein
MSQPQARIHRYLPTLPEDTRYNPTSEILLALSRFVIPKTTTKGFGFDFDSIPSSCETCPAPGITAKRHMPA